MPKEKKDKITIPLTRSLRYNFNPDELREIGKRLGETRKNVEQLEKDKKRVTSDFTARINMQNSESAQLANKVTAGYEFREIDCTATLNHPKTGQKTIIRNDTFEKVGTEEMLASESQMALLPDDDKAPSEKAKPETN